ncbi:hypothetical protein XFF6166_280024 [Xanthomonas citri pv. fuscans]|nr:hypothetical protein XFF6166_280024 [Xanthomonas citri pv. fuscans]SON99695.1 hypothetical protein XFF6960_20024 [Xanthomonas citri pv. fuscans]SOO05485.1 hypothetical protein XFF7767_420025 [Xanthomonas citri pv. fuscans]SOO08229.1 hypothetical protein XFF6970_160078 [Xanthomonas citri pv. fuscans]
MLLGRPDDLRITIIGRVVLARPSADGTVGSAVALRAAIVSRRWCLAAWQASPLRRRQ